MSISRIGRLSAVLLFAIGLVACGSSGPGGNDQPNTPPDPPAPPGGSTFQDDFLDESGLDPDMTDADVGVTEVGVVLSVPTTSRRVYVVGYQETDNGVNSGRGQYHRSHNPLIGTDVDTYYGPQTPPSSQGRRMQICVSDTKMGAAGTITGVAWGPHRNQTYAAVYDNVKLRMGYKAEGSGLSLGPSFSNNYEGAATLVYDGSYTVAQIANVGNTLGHPTVPHVGGYSQGAGCTATAGGWNKSLFDYTGFYDYPPLTTVFNWSPGDFSVEGDSLFLFEVSAQAGSTFQEMRSWFATTYPCSGILIGGYPVKHLASTYENDGPNPPDNFMAGILNPAPQIVDTCFTITRLLSLLQSKWIDGAYGDDTDYQPAVILPATQTGNARIIVEFQGADLLTPTGGINQTAPFTNWVTDINDCDGMRHIRYRIQLIPDPITLDPARVESVSIQMLDANP